jgi:hypothetical protein
VVSRVVCEASWVVVGKGGAGGVVPSSQRRVLMNVSVRSHIPLSAGQQIAVGHSLWPV